jgi:hypothetical protein
LWRDNKYLVMCACGNNSTFAWNFAFISISHAQAGLDSTLT